MSAATFWPSRSGNPARGWRSISQSISNPFRFLALGGKRGDVAAADRFVERGEAVFKTPQSVDHRRAVLGENLRPQLRVAGGDAGGVAPAGGGELQPFFRRGRGEGRGDE